MEFLSSALVIIGVIVFLAGMSGGAAMSRSFGGSSLGALTGSLPGIFLTLIGIMCVMLVQVGRATVDTAEMTGKLLKNSNEELKLLKSQGARPAGTTKAGASFEGSTDRSAPDGSATKSDMAKQRGERISSVIDGMHGDRKSLARRDEAK